MVHLDGNYYYITCFAFFTPVLADDLSLESSDSKSQVSRILSSIQADLSNTVVFMVSAHPPISNSSSPLTKSLGATQNLLITLLVLGQDLSTCLSFRFL